MDFFERQRAARGTSLRLVLLFALAVICIVAINDAIVLYLFRQQPAPSLWAAVGAMSVFTLLVIACGTGSKLLALRAGGAAVAQSVGAVPVDPTTSDPRLRRFVNVVEEMAIASGVPVPRLFVLEQEPGINAFAAGYTGADAAITVTSGALDRLNRDELQGVIGHEFSHVLNGDMRLNVRLIGLLNGILLLGLVGLRFLQFGGGRSRDSKAGPLFIVAIALVVLGFVGQFFAGLIKAAVGRQREWLADASAVQFTRQTTGLAGALKKIAGLPTGSALSDRHGAEQVSHMLFGEGKQRLSSSFATHPPLLERIAALDPTVNPGELAQLQRRYLEQPPDGLAEDSALGLAGPAPVTADVSAGASARVEPQAVRAQVRSMTPDDLDRGARLNSRIPQEIRAAATQQSTAVPLVLALLLDARPEVRAQQLRTIRQCLGPSAEQGAAGLADLVAGLAAVLRFPVTEIAVPQLAARPAAERVAVRQTIDALVRADGVVTVFEYCLSRLVAAYLKDADAPVGRSRQGRAAVGSIEAAALTLLAVVAAAGNADPQAAQRAFAAAVGRLLPGRSVPFQAPAQPWVALDAAWDPLNDLDPQNKRVLIEALVAAVADDGVVTAAEAELLRVTCALLRCPLPPLVE